MDILFTMAHLDHSLLPVFLDLGFSSKIRIIIATRTVENVDDRTIELVLLSQEYKFGGVSDNDKCFRIYLKNGY